MSIRKLQPLARTFASGVVKPQPKRVDTIYTTPAYEAWRRIVIARADSRCEAVDDGRRCSKAAPYHRMFADHVQEIQDGGAAFDPNNGMCVCGSHHTIKTMRERAKRGGA